MKKLTLMLALVFSIGAVNCFAADKDKQAEKEKKEKKEQAMMKLAPGKSCSKKCADKEEKKADKEEKKEDKKS